jgi:hypothetical protein
LIALKINVANPGSGFSGILWNTSEISPGFQPAFALSYYLQAFFY